MDVDEVNAFENGTTPIADGADADIPTGTQIANLVISLLTVTINAVVVACLITHRRLFPQVLWYQTASLCISDIVAGVSPGFLCLTIFQPINHSTKACSALIIFFHCAQLTCVFNVWQMSVRRLLVIKRPSKYQSPIDPWRVAIMPVLMWCCSFLCFVPLISQFRRNPTIPGCNSPLIWRNNFLPVALVYEISLQLLAVTTLSAFYVYAICVVTKNLRSRIVPVVHVDDSENPYNHSEAGRVVNGAAAHAQKRAFKQLCAVVLVTNITTWPYVLISIGIVVDVLPYQFKDLGFIDLHVLCMNSLLNPFIYGLAIKEMRVALKENVRNLSRAMPM